MPAKASITGYLIGLFRKSVIFLSIKQKRKEAFPAFNNLEGGLEACSLFVADRVTPN
jgi:hypothetical protein